MYSFCKNSRFSMKSFIVRSLTFILILGIHQDLVAQARLSGIISDQASKPIAGARIMISRDNPSVNFADSTLTAVNGAFNFTLPEYGFYRFRVYTKGQRRLDTLIEAGNTDKDLGIMTINPEGVSLDMVRIRAAQGAVQRGDTTEYSASNYRVNRDADAEQLLRKMPGITTENGQIKAQGETVQRVTVDGKEFFGDDVNTALRSLPSEVVGRVQVFDRMSDQSFFTGFDDGNSQKAINIVTRSGRNNGVFGKVYGGYGTDERYQSGAIVNWFKGIHRFTFLGMANNINQQNFNSQDLLGLGGGSGGFSGMRGGGMRGMAGRPGGGPPGGFGGGNNAMSNFLVGQSGGISTTQSAGLNYSTTIAKKMNLSTSYFFNRSVNVNENTTVRDFYTQRGASQLYRENTLSETENSNHRLNVRLEYQIDSFNSMIYNNRLSFQQQTVTGITEASNTLRSLTNGESLLNSAANRSITDGQGYNLSHSLLYRRRFNKPFRTFSINLSHDENRRTSNTNLFSLNRFYEVPDTSIELNQLTNSENSGQTYSGNITYTEPSGKNGQWQIGYQPSYSGNYSERFTRAFDSSSRDYTRLDSLLSNRFTTAFLTNRGELMYRRRGTNFNAMLGFNVQWISMVGRQDFPFTSNIDRPFFNILPRAMYQLRLSPSSNIRFFYRTATNLPSASQLQEVVDNSNPLLLNVGNKELVQDFNQFMVARYGWSKPSTGENVFAFVMHNRARNYIANSTFIAPNDTVLDGITLLRGAQLNRPVNMNGYGVVRSFFSYGKPLRKLKSNVNANGGVSYTKVPGLVNGVTNFANTWNLNAGAVFSSNISEQIDFTLSYSAFYNLVNNTIRIDQNNNFLQQTGTARTNWQLKSGWVFSTDLAYTGFSGLGDDFRQNFLLWNAGIGYKFLKDQAGELRITAFDILGQNNSLSRNVTETYVEDVQTRVLQRYFMLNFTYNLRYFKRSAIPANPDTGTPGRG